tara:strand:- start:530 stop:811 length:282 start_codon:yes stop_codon:yes gene_type:complete
MHPLTDAKGYTFGAFVGLAKRGVSADYNRAIPILSVFAEFIMLNRELIKSQGLIKSQREKALAVAKEDVLTGAFVCVDKPMFKCKCQPYSLHF